MSLKRGMDLVVNDETHHHDAPVKVGELQVWDVVNETGMDHPFHLHGFFFQVLAVERQAARGSSWEDTVNLARRRARRASRSSPTIGPGSWMYHCHILEHHAAGMMGHFEVVREAKARRLISLAAQGHGILADEPSRSSRAPAHGGPTA